MTGMLQDNREITQLTWGDGEGESDYKTRGNCDSITVYCEEGGSLWFTVHKAGVVIARVNAASIREVSYK